MITKSERVGRVHAFTFYFSHGNKYFLNVKCISHYVTNIEI